VQTRAQGMFACIFVLATLHPGIEATPALDRVEAEFDLVGLALAAAQRAHARGEWGGVRSWAALAAVTSERDRGSTHVAYGRDPGNAAHLLDVLCLYDRFAYGRESERDAQVDSMVAVLAELDHLNRHARWWTSNEGVEYDARTRLVRQFDGQSVEYDPWTQQIVRFGRIQVDYDPWSRMPRRIGLVEIAYDAFDHFPRAIAGVEIR